MRRHDAILSVSVDEGVAFAQRVHRHHRVCGDLALREPGARDATSGQHHGQAGERGSDSPHHHLPGGDTKVSVFARSASADETLRQPLLVGQQEQEGYGQDSHHANRDGVYQHEPRQGGSAHRDRAYGVARRYHRDRRHHRRQYQPAAYREHLLQELTAPRRCDGGVETPYPCCRLHPAGEPQRGHTQGARTAPSCSPRHIAG